MSAHLLAVAVDVDRLAALLRELDGELEREAVGRGERERLLARDHGAGAELLEQLEAALERLGEPLLLEPQHARDLVRLRRQLGIRLAHLLDDDAREAVDVTEPDALRLLRRRGG